MLELTNLYRVEYKKSDPIFVAGLSIREVILRLEKDLKDGDVILSVCLQIPNIFV